MSQIDLAWTIHSTRTHLLHFFRFRLVNPNYNFDHGWNKVRKTEDIDPQLRFEKITTLQDPLSICYDDLKKP